ncbi:MAG: hypothetical protein HOV68_09975 [Streptomycetaceae bacterium]|nr:hypothetical protein [Streptomycetaceae bacterium]
MTNDQTADELAALTHTVAQGQAAEVQRADLIRNAHAADPARWTQTRLADASGISQAAVSKILNRLALDHSDKPGFLLGRLLGVATWVEGRLYDHDVQVSWERLLDKMIAGTWPPVDSQLDIIRRGVAADLKHLAAEERAAAQAALTDIDACASAPLGMTTPTQQQRMWMVLGMESQQHGLRLDTTGA